MWKNSFPSGFDHPFFKRFRLRTVAALAGLLLAASVAGCGSDSEACHVCFVEWTNTGEGEWGVGGFPGSNHLIEPGGTFIGHVFANVVQANGVEAPYPVPGARISLYLGPDGDVLLAPDKITVLAINPDWSSDAALHGGDPLNPAVNTLMWWTNVWFGRAYDYSAMLPLPQTAPQRNGIYTTVTDEKASVEAVPINLAGCPGIGGTFELSLGISATISANTFRYVVPVALDCG